MSSQDERERAKRERVEREIAAAAGEKRRRLLRVIGGVVVGAGAVAALVFALAGGDGGDGDDADIDPAELTRVAKSAGCEYRTFPDEGNTHADRQFTAVDYKTNPPTSGDHVPPGAQAPDGLYVAGNEPGIGNWVHTLEHGRIIFQYRPGTSGVVVAQLERLFNEDVNGSGGGYHSVLMRNNTSMPFQVAAVTWRHYMACATFTPKALDALRLFRAQLVDKGPELVP